MKKLFKTKGRLAILLLLLYGLISILLWRLLANAQDSGFLGQLLARTGFWAPLAMFLAQVLQVLVTVIPVTPISLTSGYLFGPFWGFVIAYLGLVLGSFLAFALAKVLGRPLVNKLVSQETREKYDGYIAKVNIPTITFLYLAPFFPDDEITYLLGASKTKFSKMILPIMVGKIGGAVIAIAGGGLATYSLYGLPMILVLLVATAILLLKLKAK